MHADRNPDHHILSDSTSLVDGSIHSEEMHSSRFEDAANSVEMSHEHHCTSLPGSSSASASLPPSVSPSPPVSTHHTTTIPSKDTALLPKKAVPKLASKRAPSKLHHYSQKTGGVSVNTIPSEDMALGAARYHERVEIQERFDAASSRGVERGTLSTLPSHAGRITSALEQADAVVRFAERLEHRLALACAATKPSVSEQEKTAELMLLLHGQKSPGARTPEAATACDITQRSDGTAHKSRHAASRDPAVKHQSDKGTADAQFKQRRPRTGDSKDLRHQTVVDRGRQHNTKMAIETSTSAAGGPSDCLKLHAETSFSDAAAAEQMHAGEHLCEHPNGVRLQSDSQCEARLNGGGALCQEALETKSQKLWRAEEQSGPPQACTTGGAQLVSAGSSSQRSTSSSQEQSLRSTRWRLRDLDVVNSGTTTLRSATELATSRNGRLLDSQVQHAILPCCFLCLACQHGHCSSVGRFAVYFSVFSLLQ
jgi:hypothetical protein